MRLFINKKRKAKEMYTKIIDRIYDKYIMLQFMIKTEKSNKYVHTKKKRIYTKNLSTCDEKERLFMNSK